METHYSGKKIFPGRHIFRGDTFFGEAIFFEGDFVETHYSRKTIFPGRHIFRGDTFFGEAIFFEGEEFF